MINERSTAGFRINLQCEQSWPGDSCAQAILFIDAQKGTKKPAEAGARVTSATIWRERRQVAGLGSPVDPDIARNPLRFARLFFQQNRFALSYLFSYFLKIQS